MVPIYNWILLYKLLCCMVVTNLYAGHKNITVANNISIYYWLKLLLYMIRSNLDASSDGCPSVSNEVMRKSESIANSFVLILTVFSKIRFYFFKIRKLGFYSFENRLVPYFNFKHKGFCL